MAVLGHHERPADWYEEQYNPRLTPPEMLATLGSWPHRAAATRSRRPHLAEIPTGEHPRERLDLFRAAAPRGTVVFIHGGFWRTSSKDDMSWVADGFVGQGYSVALLNYPLCPQVTLDGITESVCRSVAKLRTDILDGAESQAVTLVGHSAGGYLVAALIATRWSDYGVAWRPFDRAVAISGLFDLTPLVRTSHNQALCLDEPRARSLSLTEVDPQVRVPLTLVVGEYETTEFHRQSAALASAWAALRPDVVIVPGANHYDIVWGLAEVGSVVNRLVAVMAAPSSAGARTPEACPPTA